MRATPSTATGRLCEMTGYSREEVLSPGLMVRVIAPEDLPFDRNQLLEALESARGRRSMDRIAPDWSPRRSHTKRC